MCEVSGCKYNVGDPNAFFCCYERIHLDVLGRCRSYERIEKKWEKRDPVAIGDIYHCVLEDGSDDVMYSDPLCYDAVFRSLFSTSAISYIKKCNFPNAVIHQFIRVTEGKYIKKEICYD